uniref:WASp (inferred by orthology to a D. melanogaster protein) n=1 Tax=Strongyloides venezuelensis TaxID=75913 RepID=A0A0K0G1N6_STRVS
MMRQKEGEGDFTKINNEKRRIVNNGSIFLTPKENGELFNLLDIDEYAICCGVCGIFKTNKHFSPGWEMIGRGIVVYIKDYSKKLYSLKLFCLTTKRCVWEYILHTNFMPVFGFERKDTLEFESKGLIYCIYFSNRGEAQLFYKLFKKKFERDDNQQLIHDKKVTENDISFSSKFSHLLNMDCTGDDKMSNINSNNKIVRDTDRSVKELLEAAGFDYIKMKEKDIKFARSFVKEYEKRRNESKSNLMPNNSPISLLSNTNSKNDNFKMIPASLNGEITISNKTLPIPPPLPSSMNGKRNISSRNSDNFKLSFNNGSNCSDLMEQIRHGKILKHVNDTVKLQQSAKKENSTDLNTSLTEALRKVMNERRKNIYESDSSSSSNEDWN